jgi:membrane protein
VNPVESGLRRLDRFQQRHAWLGIPVAVLKKYGDDQAGNLAALMAYYAFLAIFPSLLVLVTVFGLVLRNNEALQERVLNSALLDFPVIGDQLRQNVHSLNATGVGLGVGLGFALIGARGVANSAQNALNGIWAVPKVERPGFPWNLLRSLGLLGLVGVFALAGAVLAGLSGGSGLWGVGLRLAGEVASLLVNIGLFVGGFRLATAKQVRTRELVPGAVAAAIVWQALLALGGYLVNHNLRHASQVYGTFGLVLGLLSWLYLQAQVTLYLVEADVVRVMRLWPRSLVQPPLTAGDERAYSSYVTTEVRRPEQQVDVRFTDQRE